MRKLAPSLILSLESFYSSVSTIPGKKNKICFFVANVCDLVGLKKASTFFYSKLQLFLEKSNSYLVYKSYQLIAFLKERKVYLGSEQNAKLKDELFLCSLKGKPGANKLNDVEGYYLASWTHLGLKLEGYLVGSQSKIVRIELNGIGLREFPVSRIFNQYGIFSFTIKRDAIKRFPSNSNIMLFSGSGGQLLYKKSPVLEVDIPHGDKTIFDESKKTYINKKGHVVPSAQEVIKNQAEYLEIYDSVRRVMQDKFGISVFLMYGTLLGHVREGDLIQGDDDFDVGYWSHCDDVESVKLETQNLVVELVLHGFVCSFNRKGRLFRIALPNSSPGVHLDIRPVWFEEGHVWAHRQAKLKLEERHFIPVKEERLRGKDVYVPKDSEAFLEAYYGKGWKVPDPSYSNEKIPGSVKKYLNKINIRPGEYRKMQEEISMRGKDYPSPGRFVSIGLADLYD